MNVGDAGCTGKATYRSKGDAIICLRKRLKGSRVNTKTGRKGLRPYQCRSCRQWHIGASQQ